ncbi:MAG: peptidoglycan-binding domain-containing protein [Cyanobacteriota bacterium]|nr:peptidoglycan-binding domain-containing protein [Cyanobacteriota bacterium]
MKGILDEDQLDKYRSLFIEYCQLATCSQLDEVQADRMMEILERSQNDAVLNLVITEADHIVAHELGLMEGENKQFIHEWQYSLDRTIFVDRPETMEFLMAELYEFTHSKTQQLQSRLREQGFDPGPVDGVLGQRTHAAIKAFQTLKGNSDRSEEVTQLCVTLGLS